MTSPIGSPTEAKRLVLAISTSGPRGSLALSTGQEIEWEKRAVHSELATVKLRELLDSAGFSLPDLTHIAVNIGPGSFTGIRVGINLAKTLGYALHLPVAPLEALALIAQRELKPGERGLVATRAIEGHFYTAVYTRTTEGVRTEVPPRSATPSELEELGAGARALVEGQALADAHVGAREVLAAAERPKFFSWDRINPLYVRLSEAEEKMRRGLLKPLA